MVKKFDEERNEKLPIHLRSKSTSKQRNLDNNPTILMNNCDHYLNRIIFKDKDTFLKERFQSFRENEKESMESLLIQEKMRSFSKNLQRFNFCFYRPLINKATDVINRNLRNLEREIEGFPKVVEKKKEIIFKPVAF